MDFLANERHFFGLKFNQTRLQEVVMAWQAVAIRTPSDDSWNSSVREVCDANHTPLEFVHHNSLEPFLARCRGTVALYLQSEQFTWNLAAAVLRQFEYSLFPNARYIGLIPLPDGEAVRRYHSKVANAKGKGFEGGLILIDERHSSIPSERPEDGNFVLRPYDGGLKLGRIKQDMQSRPFSCLSGRLNGRFHHFYVQDDAIATKAKAGETIMHPRDIRVPHVFVNTCCSSVRTPSHNLTDPFSEVLLTENALSYIGSTRVHQGFPQLEALYPNLLKQGYSVGETNAILNAVISNSGFDSPLFLLYGDPDIRFAAGPRAVRTLVISKPSCGGPIVFRRDNEPGVFGAVDGPSEGQQTVFVWNNQDHPRSVHANSTVGIGDTQFVNSAVARELALRDGVDELKVILPAGDQANKPGEKEPEERTRAKDALQKLRVALTEIDNKLNGKRRHAGLSALASLSRVRYDLKESRDFNRSAEESARQIKEIHSELRAYFTARSNLYWKHLRTDRPAALIGAVQRPMNLNYYDLYEAYHRRCENVQAWLTEERCPYCDARLFSRYLRVARPDAQRRVMTCPLDWIVADAPVGEAVDALTVERVHNPLDKSQHVYTVDFQNCLPHQVTVSAFAGLAYEYLNDQCHSRIVALPTVDCLPLPTCQELAPGMSLSFAIKVSPVSEINLKMYMLHLFLFSDLRLHFGAANHITPSTSEL